MTEKISHGIFGGSFDPPHLGHLEIIKHIKNISDRVYIQLNTDLINKLKGNTTPYFKRAAWLEMSLKDEKISDGVEICHLDYEKGLSGYTIHFLGCFMEIYKTKPTFFLGADQVELMNEWVGFPEHFNYSNFAYFKRGKDVHWHDGIREFKNNFKCLDWVIPSISSTEIRVGNKEVENFLTPSLKKVINAQ